MTRILITGAEGFIGIHLTDYFLAQGHQLFGFDKRPSHFSPALIEESHRYFGDITDQKTLEQVLSEVKPNLIFHLAGLLKSNTVQEFYLVNVQGTVALLEAVMKAGLTTKILITSSSAVYGAGLGNRLITEQFKLRPLTHYAVSKVAQEVAALRYHRAYRLPVICTRTFNLIGPGQSPELACSAFARQIALAELSQEAKPIVTGNLTSLRDFVDVRDAVCAYDLVIQKGQPGQVYNVCSERAISIQQCLDILIEMARVPVKTTVDSTCVQSSDVPAQVGSASKLRQYTGWTSKITLRQSLVDLLDDWRQKVELQSKVGEK